MTTVAVHWAAAVVKQLRNRNSRQTAWLRLPCGHFVIIVAKLRGIGRLVDTGVLSNETTVGCSVRSLWTRQTIPCPVVIDWHVHWRVPASIRVQSYAAEAAARLIAGSPILALLTLLALLNAHSLNLLLGLSGVAAGQSKRGQSSQPDRFLRRHVSITPRVLEKKD